MFKNLLNLSYNRTPLEALGFYIVYNIIIFLLSIFTGVIINFLGFLQETASQDYGFNASSIGTAIALISCLVLSFTILIKKKIVGNFIYIILAIISGIAALFSGTFGGLVVASFITTRKRKD